MYLSGAGVIIVIVQGLVPRAGTPGTSVEDVCRAYPERVARLFSELDLERKGLEAVKAAADAQDWPKACQALLDYYKSSAWSGKMRIAPKTATGERDAGADAVLNDTYTFYEVAAKVPRRPDGGLDWTYNGPTGDKEWGWGLNRQPWIQTLLDAYAKTGSPVYVTALDTLLRDWVGSNPYPGVKNTTPQWRGLEVFMRVADYWPPAFYSLQDVPEFTPAAKILMLSSIPDHAHYNRNFHAGGGNWITMELQGLASAATYWPEFKDANAWFDYTIERMTPELTKQVYADGAQKELSVSYHRVALHSFEAFADLAVQTGRKLPDSFTACIERMYNYVAYTMDPCGNNPLNNDSDLDSVRDEVLAHADTFKRSDWAYIATNGARGVKPDGPPSNVFPWAGQVVMRSDFSAEAHWAFFDVGPMGTGHWHFDKLHLSVNAYGRDILVDSGRFTYQGGPWRSHFAGSASHNVILVDGRNQKPFANEAEAAMSGNYAITPEYDFARGIVDSGYDGVEGVVTHERAVVYIRNGYWLVVDRVATDRPHEITALWHFHPECTVAADGLGVASVDEGKGNVRVTPSSGIAWNLELIKGREEPTPQGWWSRKYNIKEPSTCAAYTVPISGSTVFAWLIVPGKGATPKGSAAVVESDDKSAAVRVEIAGMPERMFRVPFKEGSLTVE